MTEQSLSTNTSPTRRALLIGINKYPQLIPNYQLNGCVNDIIAVRRFLIEHAGFDDVRLLLSERDERMPLPADLGAVGEPDSATIRQAFADLSDGIRQGDEVVIYYSGHGIRISNQQNDKEQIGAIAASDFHFENNAFAIQPLIINREMNQAIQSLLRAGATVTVVLDACHSGGATRDLGDGKTLAREILGEVSAEGWQQLVSRHNLTASDLAAEGARGLESSGWATAMASQDNLIVLSGCRDIETSKEFPARAPTNGALTYFLLDSLKNVKAEEARQTTWQSLYPRVRAGVNAVYADQTPTLEGRMERPLFGGDWQPYEPGFTVNVTADGKLTLNGGEIHGLGKGAQVAIYPPGTSDFAAAAQQAVAEVDTADLVTSQAHVVDGGTAVADSSRARLTKPAASAALLGVQLTDVPDEIAQAIGQAQGVSDFVTLNPDSGRPDFEVRPNPQGDGWVLVPYRSTLDNLTPNDVIAQVPSLNEDDAASLGYALGLGLVHWARYWATLTRRNTDKTLGNAVSLTLLTGADREAMFQNPNDANVAQAVAPNAAGVCEVTTADNLMLKVSISPSAPAKLTVGVIVCSNDGNIFKLWPPTNAESSMAPGEEKVIGYGADLRAFTLTGGRDDQSESRYTFKAFATNATTAIDLSSLEQQQTVQDVIDAALPSRGGQRGGIPPTPGSGAPRVLWTTAELPVVVKKVAAPA